MDDLLIYRQAIDFWTLENKQHSVALEDDDELYPDTMMPHSLSFATGEHSPKRTKKQNEGRTEPKSQMNISRYGSDMNSTSDSSGEEDEPRSRSSSKLTRTQLRGSDTGEAHKRDPFPLEGNQHVEDTPNVQFSLSETSDVEGEAPGSEEVHSEYPGNSAAREAGQRLHRPEQKPLKNDKSDDRVYAASSQEATSRLGGLVLKPPKPKEPPYTSVGIVYAYDESDKSNEGGEFSQDAPQPDLGKEPRKCFTAFYIGQPTKINGTRVRRLLTAAHLFDFKDLRKLKNLTFFPESNPRAAYPLYYDAKSKKIVKCIPKKYKPRKRKDDNMLSSNDICVLFIVDEPDKDIPRVSIDNELSPLSLYVKVHEYNCSDKRNVIGYRPGVGTHELLEIEGKYTPCRQYKMYEPLTVVLKTERLVKKGMSGGPWTFQLEDDKECHVFGIQSSIVPFESYAVSPDFREDLFRELEIKYTVIY